MVSQVNQVVTGLGPDAEVVTNAQGAKQSRLDYAFHLLDAPAMFVLARILDYGAKKYAPNNWRGISVEDHLNHAMTHAFAFLAGDRSDDHLGHFFCRAHMALAKALSDGYISKQADELAEAA